MSRSSHVRGGRRPGGTRPTVHRSLTVPAERDGARLDHLVRVALERATSAPLSNADVRRVIVGGGVQVDGRVVRGAGRPVPAGARVTVRLDPARLASQHAPAPAAPPVVVFEDADLIAVNKPAGLPTVPTVDRRRDSLVTRVQRWLASRASDSGTSPAPGLGVHQRLDASTSGVVVFSKTPAGAATLDLAFASRGVEKTYLALCAVRTAAVPSRVDRALDVSGRGKRGRVASSDAGVTATTHVRVLERFEGAALVEARPATGRKHQVRAHLAGVGLPLLGDTRYGGAAHWRDRPVRRAMLHALRLVLPSQQTGKTLTVEAAPPEDFRAWLDWLRGNG